MIRQCMLLWKLQIRRCFGINEIIHGKDEGKKTRQVLFLCLYLLVGIMMAGYVAAAAFFLCFMDMAQLVPLLTAALPGIVVFVFALVKAGPMLFEKGDREILSPLPIQPAALIAARFFNLYGSAFALCAGTALPAGLIYLVMEKPGLPCVLILAAGLPFLPLLPLTAACILGTLVMALNAGGRHMRAVALILALLGTMAVVCGSMYLSFSANKIDLQDLAALLESGMLWIKRIYPPAALYAAGLAGDIAAFAVYVSLSVLVFAGFILAVGQRYDRICGILQEKGVGKSFRMERQSASPVPWAVYTKEIRRYFSSNVYVVNTLVGWLLMAAFSVSFMILGPQRATELIGQGMELEGGQLAERLARELPCLLAFCGITGNTTAVSWSMEGKTLWIAQTLPLPMRVMAAAKLLVNLTPAVPSLLLSWLLLSLGGWGTGPSLFFLPLCHVLFSAAFGLWMNRKLPNLDWSSETEAVKRGGSLFITMVLGMLSISVSAVMAFFLDGSGLTLAWILWGAALLAACAALLWDLCRKDLRGIG